MSSSPLRPTVRWTERSDGDLADPAALSSLPSLPSLSSLSSSGVPAAPCTWLQQVHGADVVVVASPGEHAGAPADAAVTATPGCPLVVRTADCAPLALVGDGTLGLVHAGWRGLLAGVVQATADAMGRLGARPTTARIGPCIRQGCYEFDGPDLAVLADRYGPGLRGTTTWGTPALDLVAGVRAACAEAGVDAVVDPGACTACDPRWYSHRARADTGRQATLAWLS